MALNYYEPAKWYTPVRKGDPEFFRFEEDFVEDGIRCIPMIVRFKLDIAGIKLPLSAWSRFTEAERNQLAIQPCITKKEIQLYKGYVNALAQERTGSLPSSLPVDQLPVWAGLFDVTDILREKAAEMNQEISTLQWEKLNNLQRFSLLKLCRPGHENRNFPKAMAEFNLLKA